MSQSSNRRSFLMVVGACALWSAGSASADKGVDLHALSRLKSVERTFDGRLGVFALDTGSGKTLGYREKERFPLCSTFKVFAVSAVLRQSERDADLMDRVIRYDKSNLVTYSPITEKHVGRGMTIAELCAAALQYSDNTAGNLLMRQVGGPTAVTAFARSVGSRRFQLDRWETALNTAIPGDKRDTSTPEEMGRSLRRLVLGDALKPKQRAQLETWLRGNTTGEERIQAGLPSGWAIGDKTGGGDYGTANDLAVLYPPQGAPVILAVYTTQNQKDAKARNDIIVGATRVVVDWLGSR